MLKHRRSFSELKTDKKNLLHGKKNLDQKVFSEMFRCIYHAARFLMNSQRDGYVKKILMNMSVLRGKNVCEEIPNES